MVIVPFAQLHNGRPGALDLRLVQCASLLNIARIRALARIATADVHYPALRMTVTVAVVDGWTMMVCGN